MKSGDTSPIIESLAAAGQRWSAMVTGFYQPFGSVMLPSLVRMPDGEVAESETTIKRMFLGNPEANIDKNLEEIGGNLQVVKFGGSTFEITKIVNDASSEDYMLHVSTYSSAISTNPGNAYELALLARFFPDKNIVYCASFGNGGSSPLDSRDRRYVEKSGRFTRVDDNGVTVPIVSVVNMYGALRRAGVNVTSLLGSDSAGGSVATALAVAMPEGAMTHGFFSARSNMVNLSAWQIATGMLLQENIQNSKANKAMSPDQFRVTDERVAHAQAILEDTKKDKTRKDLESLGVNGIEKVGALYTSMQALRRGPIDSVVQGPLLPDTNALIQNQPDAKLTYFVGERDPLYLSPERANQAIRDFMAKLTIGTAPVRAIVHSGTHAMNTHFPEFYLAAKKQAYS